MIWFWLSSYIAKFILFVALYILVIALIVLSQRRR